MYHFGQRLGHDIFSWQLKKHVAESTAFHWCPLVVFCAKDLATGHIAIVAGYPWVSPI